MLYCHGLTKVYQKRAVVEDFSLHLPPGRILGLVGPNGAGKSTLLKMITGLIWPSAGQVTLNGFDVHRQTKQALAKVGAIIEYPAFYPDLSARTNLDILSGGHGKAYEQKMREIIKLVDLEGKLGERVGRFSTGMRQRLGIALALLPDSEFIILDEPTNGLDPNGLVETREIIKEYLRLFGTTMLVTTHLLSEVEQFATDIAIINQGKLVANGDINDLLTGRQLLTIRVSDADAAAKLLEKSDFPLSGCRIMPDNELEYLLADAECMPEINALLVNNNIKVSRLVLEKRTLESFFLEMTNGGGYVA